MVRPDRATLDCSRACRISFKPLLRVDYVAGAARYAVASASVVPDYSGTGTQRNGSNRPERRLGGRVLVRGGDNNVDPKRPWPRRCRWATAEHHLDIRSLDYDLKWFEGRECEGPSGKLVVIYDEKGYPWKK